MILCFYLRNELGVSEMNKKIKLAIDTFLYSLCVLLSVLLSLESATNIRFPSFIFSISLLFAFMYLVYSVLFIIVYKIRIINVSLLNGALFFIVFFIPNVITVLGTLVSHSNNWFQIITTSLILCQLVSGFYLVRLNRFLSMRSMNY